MKPKRNSKQKDILFIVISSFIVVAAWIGFNLYHIYVTSTVSDDLQLALTPINPDFDKQTLQHLKSRKNINPLFQSPISSSAATPTPEPLPTITTPTTEPSPQPLVAGTPSTVPSGTTGISPSNLPINRQG